MAKNKLYLHHLKVKRSEQGLLAFAIFTSYHIGGDIVKGYVVGFGYMGYIPSIGMYRLFETEKAYEEYFFEMECEL